MNLQVGQIYELTDAHNKKKWVVYVKITSIEPSIEGDLIEMRRLLVKGGIDFPHKYAILEKYLGHNVRIRECKQSDVVLELLDDE